VVDPADAVRRAIESPILSESLAEIARGRSSACVVISDITRPVPNPIILPPVLAAAAQSLPDLGILGNSARLVKQK